MAGRGHQGPGLWQDGGHRWRTQAAPAKVRQAQLLTARHAGCSPDGFASKIGSQQTQQRLAPAPQWRPGRAENPAGKGMAGYLHYQPKRLPALRRLAQPRGQWPLVPPVPPTSRRRSGWAVVGTAGAGAHHSHSQTPQPRSSQPPGQGGSSPGAGIEPEPASPAEDQLHQTAFKAGLFLFHSSVHQRNRAHQDGPVF